MRQAKELEIPLDVLVYLTGDGSALKCQRLNIDGLESVFQAKTTDTFALVDGYTQDELKVHLSGTLREFWVLATCCQYDVKSEDAAQRVVVPAWQLRDLEAYAQGRIGSILRCTWTTSPTN